MSPSLDTWRQVTAPSGAPLLDAASDIDPTDVAAVARLRIHWPREQVAVALQLTQARRKAVEKFPEHAAILLADPPGVEQASSLIVARHKAARLIDAGAHAVMDLCCGIGGDAMGLRFAGLDVLAVDHDPVRAWMAGVNAGCSTATCDVQTLDVAGSFIHIDPARRTDRGRVYQLENTLPPPPIVGALLSASTGAALKLSPAIDREALARQLPPGELQFISHAGRLVQAVLWTGQLARGHDTATLITADATYTLQGPSPEPIPGNPDQFIFTIDPAVERARLIGSLAHPLDLRMPHPRLGLLTGPAHVRSPWLTAFRLVERMPWQRKRVARWLSQHEAGIVEVKTRGKAVNPDTLQPALSGSGPTPFTLFILRHDHHLICLICERIAT